LRASRRSSPRSSNSAADLTDAADRLGINVQSLQELQFAFGQAGVRGEQVNAALGGLSLRMEQARAGTGPAASAFRALGLRLTDAAGQMLPVSEMLPDIAREMGRIVDPARRVQLATQLFGGAGRRLVGLLHDGAGGLEEMRGRLEDLGGGMSDEAVSAADDFGDSLDQVRTATLSVKSQIALALLPTLTRFSTWLAKTTGTISKFVRGTSVVQVSMGAIAVVMGFRLLPVLQRAVGVFWNLFRAQAAAFLGIAAAVLIIDDLIALFTGGNSAIGQFLDRMFGVGTSQRFVVRLREAWEGLQLAFHNAGETLSQVWADIQTGASNAWTWISGVVTDIENLFVDLWTSVDDALGGALGRMYERFRAWVEPIRQTLATIGLVDSDTSHGTAARSEEGILDFWRNEILGGAPATPTASGPRATAPAAARPARITHQVNHNAIHVTSTDPAAAAREVDRRLAQQRQTDADAAHPVPQQEG
jgi:hypothetical protein